jgi:hypothetical protein
MLMQNLSSAALPPEVITDIGQQMKSLKDEKIRNGTPY